MPKNGPILAPGFGSLGLAVSQNPPKNPSKNEPIFDPPKKPRFLRLAPAILGFLLCGFWTFFEKVFKKVQNPHSKKPKKSKIFRDFWKVPKIPKFWKVRETFKKPPKPQNEPNPVKKAPTVTNLANILSMLTKKALTRERPPKKVPKWRPPATVSSFFSSFSLNEMFIKKKNEKKLPPVAGDLHFGTFFWFQTFTSLPFKCAIRGSSWPRLWHPKKLT